MYVANLQKPGPPVQIVYRVILNNMHCRRGLTNYTGLILTAEAEYAVIHASHTPAVRPSTARPSTAKPPTPISEHIPALLDAIQSERTYVEDEFQARVCLGWIHWQLEGWEAAVARLPKNVEQEFAQLEGTKKESAEWTKVCALKATYIKGNSEERIGKVAEALETYESSLPIYATVSATIYQGKELKIWTELYLTGFCTLASRLIKPRITSILETETLSAFRAWSSFWDHQSAISGGQVFHAEVPRRQVWRDYYFILSDILQQEVPYPTTSLVTSYASHSTRSQQRAELKEVEAKYESLLLNEVTFPKSEDPSEEIEAFVETAMQNWRILSGSGWAVEDLGEGGTDILSRGVLDLLYRAATKTFHSTAILRYLFTVHRAVAEFDLAFKAFDTYMDIVKRARARVEKTGVPEHGLDNDQTVLVTASECIKSLCRYGSRDSAEKAKELGHFFETWLDKHYPVEISANVVSETSDGDTEADESVHIDPHIFALAWRCIGIGYANWARFTFEGSARTNIQLQAIACFKKALRPEYESSGDVETLFALGTILAERREIAIALQVVKSGLQPASASSKKVDNSARSASGRFARERSLIPLWHLMALLLSAKQDFATAARSCEGAFEQFQDPKNLFGDENLKTPYQSDHLQLSEKSSTKHVGVVDSMDDFEKEGVLEVKMTQLALVEVMEGPEVAVNASDELLALYTRLFGDPSKESVSPYPNKSLMPIPPKSSAGTLRSIKGSIFGRSGRSIRKARPALITEDGPITVARPQTSQTVASTQAPMIQVTNENGNMAQKPHHLKKPDRRSGSLSRLDGATSTRARSTSTGRRHASSSATLQNNPASVDGETYFTPLSEKSDNRSGVLADIPQSPASFPPALISPPSITPITHFPKNQERRRRTTILVKVWLLISGFYRRASMYEDARGAIEEADKLVSILDDDISRDITGDVSMNNPGWGGRKCVGELLGDVCSEVRLFLCCYQSKLISRSLATLRWQKGIHMLRLHISSRHSHTTAITRLPLLVYPTFF